LIDLKLIVVNYRTYELLEAFVDSYMEFASREYATALTIVDVDPDGSGDWFSPQGNELVRLEENWGYARACNIAASIGEPSRNIAFFNADTRFIDHKCVDSCIRFLDENNSVGVVGPLQYSSSGKATHAGIFGSNTHPSMRGWHQRVSNEFRNNQMAVSVSGSAYFTKRSVWNEMMECEIFKEQFPESTGAFPPFPHFYEETLYSYHVRDHGYEVWYLGEAEMIHEWHKASPVGSQSENYYIGQRGFRAFCDAHGIEHD